MASAWLASWTGPSAQETEWVNELAEAQHLLRDVAIDLQDRDAKFKRGADAARLTAGIRRKSASMASRLERLELEILPQLSLAPPEAARRRETLARMRAELELINARISGGHSNMERAALFGGQQQGEGSGAGGGGWGGASGGSGGARGGAAGGSGGYGGGETEVTVGLDNAQLVQQQRSVMQQQDAALSQICATVGALKRTSYAIGDELTLQNGMLDGLGRDVDRTQGQLQRVEQKSAQLAGTRSLTARGADGAPPAPATWQEDAQAACVIS